MNDFAHDAFMIASALGIVIGIVSLTWVAFRGPGRPGVFEHKRAAATPESDDTPTAARRG